MLAAPTPLSPLDRATMSSQAEHAEDGADARKRRASQPHIPPGAHDVPLMDQPHSPLKFARLHHAQVPRHDEAGYTHYKAARDSALANAVRTLEKELGARCAVDCLQLESQTLIVRHHSQSKLSQQELADLQKATHFDKKELQQWYKGAHAAAPHSLGHP
tara:strand:- start:12373 stop:12852 length:480 start_codon:yes stop_codon:yes gene_type:complete